MTNHATLKFNRASAGLGGIRNQLLATLAATASIVIACLALWFLYRETEGLSFETVVSHITSVPISALVASIGLAVVSYLTITAYDFAGLQYLDRPLPYLRSALTAFMAHAVGQNFEVAGHSHASIRHRLYTQNGFCASEITCLICFISVTITLGTLALVGLALLLMPPSQTALVGLSVETFALAGGALLPVPLIYLAIMFWRRKPIRIGNWAVTVATPKVALTQLGLSVLSLLSATAILYVLLPRTMDMQFLPFLGIFLLATAAGRVSGVPGGIGVIEAILLAALPQVETAALLGSMIVYRCIYYIAPLLIALTLFVVYQAKHVHGISAKRRPQAEGWLFRISPHVIGTLVFLAGILLLVSVTTPINESRAGFLAATIPLPILELSHLAGGITGVALLILARGLFARLQAAYVGALITLLIGCVILFLTRLDYESAVVLSFIAVALELSDKHFHRRGSIYLDRFSARWMATIIIGIVLGMWAGLISYRYDEFSIDLWSQFAIDAQAPRSLRAVIIATITAIAFSIWVILRRTSVSSLVAGQPQSLESVSRVLLNAMQPSANLALLGDKRFLWSRDKRAFLMYQISGNSWVAYGDPVGPSANQVDLVWAFRDLVKQEYGRPVFYHVSEERLPDYADLGLTISKLGDEARVLLRGFSLDGSKPDELRAAYQSSKERGARFEIVPRARVPSISADLRRVSDSWLADKYAIEKRFSLGSFSEKYIANFDCAVVTIDGAIVAFANLWTAPAGRELAIDLMRYDQLATKEIMDYMFVELMTLGGASGYDWFNLGMTPYVGPEQQPLAPLWHKLGNLICSHGENFYDFENLRDYKAKFSPVWRPRFLACPAGWRELPETLADTSRMISGGVAGMFGNA